LVAIATLAVVVRTGVRCAWRWAILTNRFAACLWLWVAPAAYYRSMFVNPTLPGGVFGDVRRDVSHRRNVEAAGQPARGIDA
jgi:hypothetical protein